MTDTDPIELAELTTTQLDAAGVRTLVAQLDAHTRVLEIRLKAADRMRGGGGDATLNDAAEALIEDRVRGVQITYAWHDAVWIDTLISRGGRIVLTRRVLPERTESCS